MHGVIGRMLRRKLLLPDERRFATVVGRQETRIWREEARNSRVPRSGSRRVGRISGAVVAVALVALAGAAGCSGSASAPGAASGAGAGSSAADVSGGQVDVTAYARCDGGDDTAGLKAALGAMRAGQTLVIPAGVTCRHSSVLSVTTSGVHLAGPGTLLATDERASGVWIDADDVIVDGGLTLKITGTTRRWNTYEQMKLRLVNGRKNITIRNVTIDGSAGAGIFIGNVSHFLLDHVTVLNSQGDGIHMTNGSHDGVVDQATVKGAGDDGIAVVSYRSNREPCHDIQVRSPVVEANSWGRGVSVVGGVRITYSDISVDSSNAAAVYIAQERSYQTYGVSNVRVLGGRLVHSNTNSSVDHGAVLVYASESGYGVKDVTISDLTITDTRDTATRNVGVVSVGGGSIQGVALNRFTISGGPTRSFSSNIDSGYSATGWTVDGRAVADR